MKENRYYRHKYYDIVYKVLGFAYSSYTLLSEHGERLDMSSIEIKRYANKLINSKKRINEFETNLSKVNKPYQRLKIYRVNLTDYVLVKGDRGVGIDKFNFDVKVYNNGLWEDSDISKLDRGVIFKLTNPKTKLPVMTFDNELYKAYDICRFEEDRDVWFIDVEYEDNFKVNLATC